MQPIINLSTIVFHKICDLWSFKSKDGCATELINTTCVPNISLNYCIKQQIKTSSPRMNKISSSIEITFSMVSHGQAFLISKLLQDFKKKFDVSAELLITINIPENEKYLSEINNILMPVRLIRNSVPKGYGSNHNAAFKHARGQYFAVINPDVRLIDCEFRPLLDLIDEKHAGVCAPVAFLSTDAVAPSARRFPAWRSLWKKLLIKTRYPDYPNSSYPQLVDWVSGMFMVFSSDAFKLVGGFDERYYMYYEDADICRRLGAVNLGCWLQPEMRVIHDGQYASRHNLKHFYWHCRSALRFLRSS